MSNMIGHVENPSAKIQFVQITLTAPGICAICGSGQDENGFVDTGLDFDFWGRLYFCPQCTIQLAAVFGFISPLDYADLEAELDFKKLELENAHERIRLLEGIVDGVSGLNRLFNSVPERFTPSMEVSTVEIVSDESIISTESEPIQSSSESNKSNAGESGTTSKPIGKQRLLNL